MNFVILTTVLVFLTNASATEINDSLKKSPDSLVKDTATLTASDSLKKLDSLIAFTLKGSPESQWLQNAMADWEGLERYVDERLAVCKKNGTLVHLTDNSRIRIDTRLDDERCWSLPRVKLWSGDIAKDFQKKFRHPLQVNSLVRSCEFQAELQGTNENAASADSGSAQSSHLTGATIDIAKIGLTLEELRWIRGYLAKEEWASVIEATEEHSQLVFHVMVFWTYDQYRKFELN